MGELVAITIVFALAFGIACFVAGLIDAFQTGPDWVDLGLLALVLVIASAIWLRLNAARSRTLRSTAAAVPGAATARAGDLGSSPQVPAREPPPHQAA